MNEDDGNIGDAPPAEDLLLTVGEEAMVAESASAAPASPVAPQTLGAVAGAQLHTELALITTGFEIALGDLQNTSDPAELQLKGSQIQNMCKRLTDISSDKICEAMGLSPYDGRRAGIKLSLHDAKNMTTTIGGNVSFFVEDPSDSVSRREIAKLQASARFMKKLMYQIFYRGEIVPYSMVGMIEETQRNLNNMMGDNNFRFRRQLKDGTMTPAQVAEVEVKPFKLQIIQAEDPSLKLDMNLVRVMQVFRNLASNAYDAGAHNMKITADRADGGTVKFSVDNDGEPIPPEVFARMFDHGFSHKKVGGNGGNGNMGGTGVAMGAMKGVVEAMGGRFDPTDISLGLPEAAGGLGGPRIVFYLKESASLVDKDGGIRGGPEQQPDGSPTLN